ncbi:MAG: segregation/condensation protein A [SAR116 cluster bacterium MED-G04]|jgi:segregation and condensation protein A|nr:MAG: segregation/condensation protein A [SAR116 cluster bacterium MED-G04]CAI8344933.1 MAG: Segregation and condensation protein A [SAR116 cluster bacterium MED-G04]HCD50450.1 segregation/condensation protein A [Alphaproteobacteria bacterium]HCV62142.1 segregation/condensation protein A [Alphaproteobacteria bacterium]|tara:strand:+ start:7398 stop:8189 length:792 start_codon:yes stop_codon:yes gene_type:complete
MSATDDFLQPSERPLGRDDGQLSLFVILDGFEGPIDLLLMLARDQKVDLAKLSILPLAEQYLEFIQNARDLDIEIAADYLVMAAWLAYLKSRLLIPDPQPDEKEEALDMADALKFQLMRLEAMQNAAKALMAMPRLGQERFANGQPEALSPRTTTRFKATLFDLLRAYGHISSAGDASTLTIAQTRLYTVEDAVKRLSGLLRSSPGWSTLSSFMPEGLATPLDHRSAMASHFTASLELVRDGELKLRQETSFGPIWLARNSKV